MSTLRGIPTSEQRRPGPSIFPLLLLFALLLGAAGGIGASWYARSHQDVFGVIEAIQDPLSQFPETQINLLVMGLDENWTRQDMAYTKGARTDTLLVAHLDLAQKKASLLSIPRDTRVPIAGTSRQGKINSAYARGGASAALATVSNFLDVPLKYYVVLRLNATQQLVDSMGGVDLDVEKDMDYDDHWGHLHIHLKKGAQHLDGEQAVGYIRFRHDVEGDFGRIRRQQQLMHAIMEKMKNRMMFTRILDLGHRFRQFVDTNLTEGQITALASLYKSISPGQLTTGYVPALEQRIHGTWFLIPDQERKQNMVDWLLKGDQNAMIPLVKVEVVDAAGDEVVARKVRDTLREAGFSATLVRGDRGQYTATQVIDYDRFKGAGALVLAHLGMTDRKPVVLPNPHAAPAVEVIVGRDAASSVLVASTPRI